MPDSCLPARQRLHQQLKYVNTIIKRGQVASSARSAATDLPDSDSFFMLLGQISICIVRTEPPLICTEGRSAFEQIVFNSSSSQ